MYLTVKEQKRLDKIFTFSLSALKPVERVKEKAEIYFKLREEVIKFVRDELS